MEIQITVLGNAITPWDYPFYGAQAQECGTMNIPMPLMPGVYVAFLSADPSGEEARFLRSALAIWKEMRARQKYIEDQARLLQNKAVRSE